MKIKGPASPLSSGAEPLEPLDPRDVQRKGVDGEGFAAALSQLEGQPEAAGAGQASPSAELTRSALGEIAGSANLTSSEGVAAAVRESARYIVRSRLGEKYRDTEHGERLADDLSDFVATDPLLKNRLLSILQRIQSR